MKSFNNMDECDPPPEREQAYYKQYFTQEGTGMKPNMLRTRLLHGKPMIGTMIQEVASPFIVHAFANAGFDFVYVDMEHGRFSLETAAALIQAIRLTEMVPLARVPDNQYHLIARVLDAGARGVMIPRVEAREQAEKAVLAARFPPLGQRGLAVARGHNDYKRQDPLSFAEEANRENLVIVQIESKAAVEHVDEIVSVPGVDAALIGPSDLSQSLGISMKMDHPAMIAAIEKVVASCKKHNVITGLHTGDQKAIRYWSQNGVLLISGASDLEILIDGSIQLCTSYREAVTV
jgi:2-keto-3-deoxy-L-rhamnonate aldolase RhmA